MDQTTLVVNPGTLPLGQRDGGDKLIRRLIADGVSVVGAAWAVIRDDHQPYVYLVTPDVDGRDPRITYRKVSAAQAALDGDGLPWDERLDREAVKLVAPTRPLAEGILQHYHRHPDDHPTWHQGQILGPVYITGAYIYPASLFRPQPAHEPAAAAPPAGV